MGITIIHTADWQLGKQFASIPGDDGAGVREQRIATVETIARLAQKRQADAILVCGDVFDSNAVAERTIRQMLHATELFEGDWVFIPGNHDPSLAESVWSRAQRILAKRDQAPNLHFLLEPEKPLLLGGGAAAILPAVLERRHEVDDLTAWFDHFDTQPGVIRVGMAHGSVRELLPDAEAPNPVAQNRSATAALDYLALGDWHGTRQINDRTWYSGTPEPDRFESKDPGKVLVVSIDLRGALPSVEEVRVGRYEWKKLEVDVYDEEDLRHLARQFEVLAPDPRNTLVSLKLGGVLDLALTSQVQEVLDDWGARLHYLAIDKDLTSEPSPDDLDRIDLGGFVRNAANQLQEIAAGAYPPENAAAQAALLRLYRLHVGMEN